MKENREMMQVEDSKVIDNKKAFDVRVIRNSKDGFQIKLQSNLDWSFLRNAAAGDKTQLIGKVQCYFPQQEVFNDIPGAFVPEGWEYEGYPNLSLLLAKDLQKGCTFQFGLIPISEDRITVWVSKLKEQIKGLYLCYLKPVDQSVEFSTHTVERTIED